MNDTPEDALLTFLRAAPVDDEPEDQPRRNARMNDRLAEILERTEAATPGPWTWNPYTATTSAGVHDARGEIIAAVVCVHADPQEDVDAAFIAHAREDVPYLLAALAAQRALVAELVGALEVLVSVHDTPFADNYALLYNDRIWETARAALERAAKEAQE